MKLLAGEALKLKACGEPPGHSTEKELAVALTGSLKLTVRFALVETLLAPLVGTVLETLGAASVLLRGLGGPAVKSAELLSVSVAPPFARSAAVLLDRPGAAAVSKEPAPFETAP